MADIASVVSVRAPSLCGRFADRATLIDAVEVGQWRAASMQRPSAAIRADPAGPRLPRSSGLVLALVAFSHGLRDLIVHAPIGPSSPAAPGDVRLGLGLWRFPAAGLDTAKAPRGPLRRRPGRRRAHPLAFTSLACHPSAPAHLRSSPMVNRLQHRLTPLVSCGI